MSEKKERKYKLHMGQRVLVDGKGGGVLRFFGVTKASKGEKRCGVDLDEPNGTHDGSVSCVPESVPVLLTTFTGVYACNDLQLTWVSSSG